MKSISSLLFAVLTSCCFRIHAAPFVAHPICFPSLTTHSTSTRPMSTMYVLSNSFPDITSLPRVPHSVQKVDCHKMVLSKTAFGVAPTAQMKLPASFLIQSLAPWLVQTMIAYFMPSLVSIPVLRLDRLRFLRRFVLPLLKRFPCLIQRHCELQLLRRLPIPGKFRVPLRTLPCSVLIRCPLSLLHHCELRLSSRLCAHIPCGCQNIRR